MNRVHTNMHLASLGADGKAAAALAAGDCEAASHRRSPACGLRLRPREGLVVWSLHLRLERNTVRLSGQRLTHVKEHSQKCMGRAERTPGNEDLSA